jgi:hypothetical protein
MASKSQDEARGDEPRAQGTAPAAPKKDPLKVVMPAGESGDLNPPGLREATKSGGTSGAEDTPRTAGYVVDLHTRNEPPPGPPLPKDPALLAGAEDSPTPPKPRGDSTRRS